jgi:hypothetical protein
MRRFNMMLSYAIVAFVVGGCARTEAIQPDRTIFNFDSSYQRASYAQPIEKTFDRAVTIFREAGYKLDVVDRATGQISGRRGQTGDKGAATDKDLRFYALVLPDGGDGSQMALRIVQIASQGIPVLTQSRAEIVLNQSELYAYIFKRIESPATHIAPQADLQTIPLEPAPQP